MVNKIDLIIVVVLKQQIEKGNLGKLFLGTIRVRWSRNQKYYDQDSEALGV